MRLAALCVGCRTGLAYAGSECRILRGGTNLYSLFPTTSFCKVCDSHSLLISAFPRKCPMSWVSLLIRLTRQSAPHSP